MSRCVTLCPLVALRNASHGQLLMIPFLLHLLRRLTPAYPVRPCAATPQRPQQQRPSPAASSAYTGTPYPRPGEPLYSPPPGPGMATGYPSHMYPPQGAYPPNQDYAFTGYPTLHGQQQRPQQAQGYGFGQPPAGWSGQGWHPQQQQQQPPPATPGPGVKTLVVG